jgi:hypothetical protein
MESRITVYDEEFDFNKPAFSEPETFKFTAQAVTPQEINLQAMLPKSAPYPMGYIWWVQFADQELRTETTPKTSKIALNLFAALEEIMVKFVQKYKPLQILFVGIGKSKSKLYTTISKKIMKRGGYKLIQTVESGGANVYYLYKEK